MFTKKILAVAGLAVITSIFLFAFFSPQLFAVTSKEAVCEGAGLVAGGGGCGAPVGSPDVDSTLKNALNLFSAIIGIIAVVMFMIGGLKYMTSQGDAGQMNNAKNTLIFAAVGLVIVALAQLIVNFVLERFTK